MMIWMETKLTLFQVDVYQETGQIRLLVKTGCNMRPVMCWPDVYSLEDFALELLNICSQIRDKQIDAQNKAIK